MFFPVKSCVQDQSKTHFGLVLNIHYYNVPGVICTVDKKTNHIESLLSQCHTVKCHQKISIHTKMKSKGVLKRNSICDGTEDEIEESVKEKTKSFWKKIPFIGLILILVKNILAGVSDIVIKNMTDMEPVTFIFFRSAAMLSLVIPWSVVKEQPPFPPGLTLRERVLEVTRFNNCDKRKV